ncbi:hypothetical protein FIM1_5070 [Kluyveromyces marxianus]|uniref:Uncharacterized protein n=1 Tax=Kluyveromyces marxianus TaxID=4911 RepID=A0ABX6F085_KLUMA|nr:hypothetical protein FIM1_5070 [Kluyveromyces marxianus]
MEPNEYGRHVPEKETQRPECKRFFFPQLFRFPPTEGFSETPPPPPRPQKNMHHHVPPPTVILYPQDNSGWLARSLARYHWIKVSVSVLFLFLPSLFFSSFLISLLLLSFESAAEPGTTTNTQTQPVLPQLSCRSCPATAMPRNTQYRKKKRAPFA